MLYNGDTTRQASINQYFECREWMNGDYYILAAGKGDEIGTKDACYEFYKEEVGKGYLMAFRPADCASELATYYLKGLDPDAAYQIRCVDKGVTWTGTGREFMENGLTLEYNVTTNSGEGEARLLYITKQ